MSYRRLLTNEMRGSLSGGRVGSVTAGLIDPIRRTVIGSALKQSSISRVNQELFASVIEGAGVGGGELAGMRIERRIGPVCK